MVTKTRIKKSEYYDSVTLMLAAKDILEIAGVQDAAVMMGTAANKALLRDAKLLTAEADAAMPNDLVISISAETEERVHTALLQAEVALKESRQAKMAGGAYRPKSFAAALKLAPSANLAIISVAGRYAAKEARKALAEGLHVLLFSDNVLLEDEIALKEQARASGMLLMGPDAGTAIINGVALGFANAVPRGAIGVVGASGTGIQEVTSLIARMGQGISHAIGVGSRDLSEAVGGMMMIEGVRALQKDADTRVIVLISKPPAPQVAAQILQLARETTTPMIVNFLGMSKDAAEGVTVAETLEEAALLAVNMVTEEDPLALTESLEARRATLAAQAAEARGKLPREQKYLRGLFSGGTFCYEAMLVLHDYIGEMYSNVPLDKSYKLADALRSQAHCAIDLGEDEFTVGRLHPMLDPTLRNRRIVQEAQDPETAVILLDVVLGYGVHDDPAGAVVEAVKEARAAGSSAVFVASVCGTNDDPQNAAAQEQKLRDAEVLVVESNAAAARLAGLLVERYT